MKKKGLGVWIFILFALLLFFLLLVKNKVFFSPFKVFESEYISIGSYETESCLQCHQNTTGYSDYHNPSLIGCTGCHLGNGASLNKEESHKGMILIPGNLTDAEQTCGKCHPNELSKIETSLMTTNSGLIAVDKFVFGEAATPNDHFHMKDLEYSASDKHIRGLCANCHLGVEKKEFGAIGQLSRGGGCNACHLNYTDQSKNDLAAYLASNKKELPKFHPSTDIFVKNEHCFGCHSRSGRISTNYEGWQETLLDEDDIKNKPGYRVLEDKRVYTYIEQDVHHANQLLCIDCHSSHEVMGDGKRYTHAEQAVTLQCADCHFKGKPHTIPFDSLDAESKLVFLHRDYSHYDKPIIAVAKDNHPLVNTYVDSLGQAFLIGKKDGSLHTISPQSKECSKDNAHKNVSCATCHSSWTPRCIGCHNEFDKDEKRAFDLLDRKYVTGQWNEFVAEFSSSLPAMGVRDNEEGLRIEPALPGMILTIDIGSFKGEELGKDLLFHRLYAPNSPHTITKNVRDCRSCHSDAATLGYGSGSLIYKIDKGVGEWVFTPEYELNRNDQLPEDAWIPFMKDVDSTVMNSTRTDFRPFNVKEQKRILLVGSCLECHAQDSQVMKQSLVNGLESVLTNISKNCVLPTETSKN